MKSSSGKAYMTSVKRMISDSVRPPFQPASAPSGRPIATTTTCAMSATVMLTCAPSMVRESRSRPRLSVPSRWSGRVNGGIGRPLVARTASRSWTR